MERWVFPAAFFFYEKIILPQKVFVCCKTKIGFPPIKSWIN